MVYEDIVNRLESLGYTYDEVSDKFMLEYLIGKVTNTIKNECNVLEVPEGLMQIAIDMICGEFLFLKKGSGQLDGFTADINAAGLKQTQSGDTNVVFAIEGLKSNEQRLDYLIGYLMNTERRQFATYRRLKWT